MRDRSCMKIPTHAALTRGFVNLLRLLDCDFSRFLVNIFAVRQLLLDDVGLGDVLQSAWPCSISSAPAIGMTDLK